VDQKMINCFPWNTDLPLGFLLRIIPTKTRLLADRETICFLIFLTYEIIISRSREKTACRKWGANFRIFRYSDFILLFPWLFDKCRMMSVTSQTHSSEASGSKQTVQSWWLIVTLLISLSYHNFLLACSNSFTLWSVISISAIFLDKS